MGQTSSRRVRYYTDYQNVLPNGLTILQTSQKGDPVFVVDLRGGSPTFGGWFNKIKNEWVHKGQLDPIELEQAQEQADDFAIQQVSETFA